MSTPRYCFYVSPNLVDDEKGFIPSVVFEGLAGHRPLSGNGTLAEPWYWGTDFVQAVRICKEANDQLGLSDDDVNNILISSMFANEVEG